MLTFVFLILVVIGALVELLNWVGKVLQNLATCKPMLKAASVATVRWVWLAWLQASSSVFVHYVAAI